jgi:hypothetical protein
VTNIEAQPQEPQNVVEKIVENIESERLEPQNTVEKIAENIEPAPVNNKDTSEDPVSHDVRLDTIKLFNESVLESLAVLRSKKRFFTSSHQCLGIQNSYNSVKSRPCRFKNIYINP